MIFKYLYYRMYVAYRADDKDPKLRSFVYLLVLKTFLLGVFFIYAEGILKRFNLRGLASAMNSYTFLIVAGPILLAYNYLMYARVPLTHYEEIFRNHEKLNKYVKVWMIIALPFIIFFGAMDFYVHLFGGQLFGKPVIGWLNQ